MLTIREKPNLFLRKTTHSVAGADHDEKKKKQETKDNKFLRKHKMQARATPRMYFCVEIVRKLCTDKPLKHCPEKKLKKKKKKNIEKAMSETSWG